MTIQQSFVPKPPASRGPHDSDDEADMIVAMHTDIGNIITQLNANELAVRDAARLLFSEFSNSRNAAARYIEDVANQQMLQAIRGGLIDSFMSFRSFAGPNWNLSYTNIDLARRARVEPLYGQVLLPYQAITNLMYTINPETDDPIMPDELDYLVTGEDEDGAHDVTAGTVKNAFNGNNQDYWIRRVRFPLEADVDSVACTLDITLPTSFAGYANMLTVHPFPLGQLDIEELKYSTDSSDPSIDVPSYELTRAAGFRRWHFSDLAMTKLRVKFRQRHFVEENGYKVFYLGAQEIALQLVGFDKTAGSAQPSDDNSVVVVLNAPSGYKFETLERCYSIPAYAIPLADTGIRLKIYADAALTNLQWSSYDNAKLEDTPKDVSGLATSTLYMLVNLAYLTSEAKSPILDDILLSYDVYL